MTLSEVISDLEDELNMTDSATVRETGQRMAKLRD